MIGLDTNVLVRYFAQDDEIQSALATRIIEQDLSPKKPGFISLVVLLEVCWVLKSLYAATAPELLSTVEDLLATPQFQLEQREVVQAAVQFTRSHIGRKIGFIDVLITQISKAHGCTHTLTFDKAAVRSAGMVLICQQ